MKKFIPKQPVVKPSCNNCKRTDIALNDGICLRCAFPETTQPTLPKEQEERFEHLFDDEFENVPHEKMKQFLASELALQRQTLIAQFREMIGENEDLYPKERKSKNWDWRVHREEGGNELRSKLLHKLTAFERTHEGKEC